MTKLSTELIEKITEDLIGLDCANCSISFGCNQIYVSAKKPTKTSPEGFARKPIASSTDIHKKLMEQEWKDSSTDFLERLSDEGHDNWELASCSHKSFTLMTIEGKTNE